MFASVIPHRLVSLLFIGALLAPLPAAAFDENRCLDEAVKHRTEDLENAYSSYNDLLERLLNRFDSVERNAYKETHNRYYRNGEVYRGQYAYSSQIQEANRNLNIRVQQIWNDYAAKVRLCTGAEYQYDYRSERNSPDPYDYFQSHTPVTYAQRYSSYPHSSTYRYPYSRYNYNYYNNHYSGYRQYPYYKYHRRYHNQCSTPVLDPHCGYVCHIGSDGCYSCRQQFCY